MKKSTKIVYLHLPLKKLIIPMLISEFSQLNLNPWGWWRLYFYRPSQSEMEDDLKYFLSLN